MKKLLFSLFAVLGILSSCNNDNNEPKVPKESEVTLFNKEAKPTVYIDYTDDIPTIYTWDGTPVAYFNGEEDIYHFNGQFLGWYVNGVIHNKNGYAVAARKGTNRGEITMSNTLGESIKGAKHIKPVPHIKSLKPKFPQLKDKWSDISLTDFFLPK